MATQVRPSPPRVSETQADTPHRCVLQTSQPDGMIDHVSMALRTTCTFLVLPKLGEPAQAMSIRGFPSEWQSNRRDLRLEEPLAVPSPPLQNPPRAARGPPVQLCSCCQLARSCERGQGRQGLHPEGHPPSRPFSRASTPKSPRVMELASSSRSTRERGAGGSSSAGASGTSGAGGSGTAGGSAAVACRRRRSASGPTAWLRRVLRGAQAVAEERSSPSAGRGEDVDFDEEEEAEATSEDGGYPADVAASFGSLPEHLLERVFSHLRGANRRHHFAM